MGMFLIMARHYGGYVVVYWLITSILFGLYLKKMQYSNWYLGCIPGVNLWFKKELGGCNILLLALQLYCTVMFFYTGITYLTVLALGLKLYHDFKFASCMMNESSPQVFAFVPLAKYYLMYKESAYEGV